MPLEDSKGIRYPKIEVTHRCKPTYLLRVKDSLLEEQSTFLATEPSPHSLDYYLSFITVRSFCIYLAIKRHLCLVIWGKLSQTSAPST